MKNIVKRHSDLDKSRESPCFKSDRNKAKQRRKKKEETRTNKIACFTSTNHSGRKETAKSIKTENFAEDTSNVEDEDAFKPRCSIRKQDKDKTVLKNRNILKIENKVLLRPKSIVGHLQYIENNSRFALFLPRDSRLSKVKIYRSNWPKNFDSHSELFKNTLFVAEIFKFNKFRPFQRQIVEVLGDADELKIENLAILREFSLHLHYSPETAITHFFRESILPRQDLRKRCVFTIDNSDTKDINNALSCEKLQNGNYEVGIHVSDVSHFVREGDELDKIIRRKGTSIYLINATYNMLPDDLCSLCSLTAGKDKPTFSIFFEITPYGKIIKKRATKSVINSCIHLSYETAQMLIDQPDNIRNDLILIYHGFTMQDLTRSVNALQNISLLLREKRKELNGLRKHRSLVTFFLDQVTGEPLELVTEKRVPMQDLVEEFMLLANITVAEKIYKAYPNLALLRIHGAPFSDKIYRLKKYLETIGIHIDVSSSKGIQESLDKYINNGDFGEIFDIVLNRLIHKCMPKEKYICAGILPKDASCEHFSLGLPIYTHFTSPIRRYADILTHRLLASTLKYRVKSKFKIIDILDIAESCNQQEIVAKKAAEASFQLYLKRFIDRHQPFIQDAVVFNVNKLSFDVVVFSTGRSVRIFTNTFEKSWNWRSKRVHVENNKNVKTGFMWLIFITFPKTNSQSEKSIVVDVFSVVKIEFLRVPRLNRLKVKLCRS